MNTDYMTSILDIQLSPLGKGLISIMHYCDWVSLSRVSKRYNLRMKELAAEQPGSLYRSGLLNWHLASRAKQFLGRLMPLPIRFRTAIGGLSLALNFYTSEYTNKNGVNKHIVAHFDLYIEDWKRIPFIPKEPEKTVKNSILDWIDSNNTSKFKSELQHVIRSFNVLHAQIHNETEILSVYKTITNVSLYKAKLMAYDWLCLFCRDTMVYEQYQTRYEKSWYGLLYLDKVYS
jgi:hypothetical protein